MSHTEREKNKCTHARRNDAGIKAARKRTDENKVGLLSLPHD